MAMRNAAETCAGKMYLIRITAAVLIFAFAASVLASCGSESTSDQTIDAQEAGIYNEIIEMFCDGIENGWESYEDSDDLSYLWYQYGIAESLSDAGYAFIDIDENGMEELLVGLVSDAEEGIIYDLYTYEDGSVVHLASGGERWTYRLCANGYIGYEGADSASEGSYAFYSISGSELVLEGCLSYVYDDDSNVTWMYQADADSESDVVTETEADLFISTFNAQEYELITFAEY